METELLTLEEFGRAVRMSKDWVGKECRAGRIQHTTISGDKRKRRLIPATEIDRLVREKTHTTTADLLRIAKIRTRRRLPPPVQRY